jgi:IS5 family transposase
MLPWTRSTGARRQADPTAYRPCAARVTADRGYGEPGVERERQALGVLHPSPSAARPTPHSPAGVEHGRGFRTFVRRRNSSDGESATSNAGTGGAAAGWTGKGASIWYGHGVFAHNLAKIGAGDQDRPLNP